MKITHIIGSFKNIFGTVDDIKCNRCTGLLIADIFKCRCLSVVSRKITPA